MAKLAIFLAIIGFAYWYWSERYQEPTQTLEAYRLQNNAATMQRCIKKEERMQATGGLTGLADVGSSGWDAERLCAEKNSLYLRGGKWHNKQDH
jgi:hypothetical protein